MNEIGSRPNVEHIVKEINMLSMSMLLFLMKYHLTSFALIISDMNDVDYYYYFTTVFLQYTHCAFLLIFLIYREPYLFTNINMLSMSEIGSTVTT